MRLRNILAKNKRLKNAMALRPRAYQQKLRAYVTRVNKIASGGPGAVRGLVNNVEKKHLPNVTKAHKELQLLDNAFSHYNTVTRVNHNYISGRIQNLGGKVGELRRLQDTARRKRIRITKDVKGRRVYKSKDDLNRNLRVILRTRRR
jgi:hypothetical protein